MSFTVGGELNFSDAAFYTYEVFFDNGTWNDSLPPLAPRAVAAFDGSFEFGRLGWWNSTYSDQNTKFGFVNFTLTGGGSTLTFTMNKSAVGPADGFHVTVVATYDPCCPGEIGYTTALGSDCPIGANQSPPCASTTATNSTRNVTVPSPADWIWLVAGATGAVGGAAIGAASMAIYARRRRPPRSTSA